MLCPLPSFVALSPQYFIKKEFKFYSEYLYMPWVEFIPDTLFVSHNYPYIHSSIH